MFDFSHLTPQGTARFRLDGVHVPVSNPKPVTLIGKHAGSSNPGWINAIMTTPEGREGGARTAEQIDAANRDRAKRMAKHVVCGWEDVLDASGKQMPYSAKAGESLLLALLDAQRPDLVQSALGFFADPDHFRDEPVVSPGDLGNE